GRSFLIYFALLAIKLLSGVSFCKNLSKYLFVGFLLCSAFILFIFYKRLQKKFLQTLCEWQKQKNIFDEQLKIWVYKKENPPILFGLVLETSASSRSIVYSYDSAQIKNAHSSIKSAMEATKHGETYISIDTVNVGGDSSINNFESEITNQQIKEQLNGDYQ
ncbi:hypothetical protein QN395_05455, partial [Undibacterium sp. RTI2.2]|uniref:hypothetical protein n=1 Tax=Undibacterium sp. RTI2.2 TaxID=3048638 RepID=UPI002B235AFF